MDITIKWQSDDGSWKDFDLLDINNHMVSVVTGIFSFKVPVIAKQSGRYFVNTDSLKRQYEQAGKNVSLIQDIKESDRLFGDVGFLP